MLRPAPHPLTQLRAALRPWTPPPPPDPHLQAQSLVPPCFRAIPDFWGFLTELDYRTPLLAIF